MSLYQHILNVTYAVRYFYALLEIGGVSVCTVNLERSASDPKSFGHLPVGKKPLAAQGRAVAFGKVLDAVQHPFDGAKEPFDPFVLPVDNFAHTISVLVY